MKKIRRRREGMTLVELIVSLALMSILMVMVVGIISPAAKVFVRMQRVQFAQLILDNVEDEIRSQMQEAVDGIKIYNLSGAGSGSVAGLSGAGNGNVLEYLNTDSYVTLMSADGCNETVLMRSGQETGKDSANSGRLLMRYYWQEKEGSETDAYGYTYSDNGKPVARAMQQVFSDKYYMGSYLKLQFSFPDGIATGEQVEYIRVNAALYQDEGYTDLLTSEDFVVPLRYKANRVDAITAVSKP